MKKLEITRYSSTQLAFLLSIIVGSTANASLSQQYKESDALLGRTYNEMLSNKSPQQQRLLKHEQRNWINNRYQQCGGSVERLPRNQVETQCYIKYNNARILSMVKTKGAAEHIESEKVVSKQSAATKVSPVIIFNLSLLSAGFKKPVITDGTMTLSTRFNRLLSYKVSDCESLKAYIAKQISHNRDINVSNSKERMRSCMSLNIVNQSRSIMLMPLDDYKADIENTLIPSVFKELDKSYNNEQCEKRNSFYVCSQAGKTQNIEVVIYPVMLTGDTYFSFINLKESGLFKEARLYTLTLNMLDKTTRLTAF